MKSIEPTHLMLNKRCELWHMTNNVAIPMGHFSVKALPVALDSLESVDLLVQCRPCGDEKQRSRDVTTYKKRMRSLPAYYSFDGFKPQVINGYETGVMVGRLHR